MADNTAVAVKKEKLPIREWLVSTDVIKSLARIATQNADPERYARMLLASSRANPRILECDPASLMLALAACVSTGLEPNTPKKEAYIIPYGGEAQFQAGFQGLEKLARRSGAITSIETRVVHINDKFEYEHGLNQRLSLIPCGEIVTEPEDLRAAYSLVHFNDGNRPSFEVLLADELLQIRQLARDKNKGKESPAWRMFSGELYRKIAFKRHYKWLPQDDIMAHAIDLDNRHLMRDGQDQSFTEAIDMELADMAEKKSSRLEKEEL